MFDELTTTPSTAFQVVIATVVVYLAFVLLLRLLGQRTVATLSIVDLASVMAVGALVGRTALLAVPSLATGLLGLVTLLLTHRTVTALQHRTPFGRWLGRAPVVLAWQGELLPDAMRRARVSPGEMRQQLRLAGVTATEQVACVILERNGEISVLREPPAPELLVDLQVPPTAPEGA
ncbi:DUF421 domain-containing protein [Nocardioides koreensis]|uniref:DUF421 domain-containing protein n=1 Tax=Nocardioides koreensis TaxID=433651 RepID=A0ABP5KYP7_9ACTN